MYVCLHVCAHTCINECINLGIDVARHTWVHMCMYAYMHECTYGCRCACMCTKSTAMTLYIYLMSWSIYNCHIANMTNTAIMLIWAHRPNLLHVCAKTQPTSQVIQQICLPICHIYTFVHVHIWHNYVSINTSYEFTAINNMTRSTFVNTVHMYKYTSDIAHICLPALLL